MLVNKKRKQGILHCPWCQGELNEPPRRYIAVYTECTHCKNPIVAYWKAGIKKSKKRYKN